jgi:hypothetical protein
MTIALSIKDRFIDFFAPLAGEQPAAQRSPSDHAFHHFSTLNGAWDGFRFGNYFASWTKFLFPADSSRYQFLKHSAGIFDKAGSMLSLPRLVTDLHVLVKSMRIVRETNSNSSSADPLQRKVAAYAKKHFLTSTMNLGNDLAQASLVLHEFSILKLGRYVPLVDSIYNATGIVNDTIELVDESVKLHHYRSEEGNTEAEAETLKEKKTLSLLKIAKNVPSIVGAVIGIAAIFFSSLQVPVVAVILLGLNTMWLTFKLTSTFYEKIATDNQMRREEIV